MSRAVVVELSDEVYESVTKAAETTETEAPAWIAVNQPRLLPTSDEVRLRREIPKTIFRLLEKEAQRTGEPVVTVAARWLDKYGAKPRPQLTEEERRAAREAFRRFCGAVNSGDPRSADNDRIDEDLAREYGSTHEEDD